MRLYICGEWALSLCKCQHTFISNRLFLSLSRILSWIDYFTLIGLVHLIPFIKSLIYQ